ncbi:peptidoglycan DD-metalloendopeptidase family protein [Nocardioides sp. MAH-18]|uniref:Peptidoglycan DD-metalloendopeptidase family protein n=1 Tax=Nocardioides agri TaxID=2682843 RepID=A0A6L6XWZ6_9ACTN|nr:M23 family metallopeptidase [Nocardioides sp. MAH-18]MVQ50976.1 peptidoglycan DD-metalloendopeptidase family protein [Nocardioides sp. MAH-18]
MVAATAACTLALGTVGVPLAFANDGSKLRDRQKHTHQQVRHAQHSLDESSGQLRRARARLTAARDQLRAARADFERANTKLAAARVRDDEMQVRLDAAEQRLTTAQQELAAGRAALVAQRDQLTDTITDIYEQGDPELLAFSALLRSETTADLTRQAEARNAIVGREARAYDDLDAAEEQLAEREAEVEDARDGVEVEREAAAAHLVEMETLRQEKRAAKQSVRTLVVSRSDARRDARKAHARDRRELRKLKKREAHIKQLILAQARHSHGGYRGSTNGLMIRPVPGSVTSSYGYREHPIYHYWGMHDGTDFGVSCGEGMRAVASGTVISKYYSSVYGNRLYISLGTINGANVTAVYNHATSYRVGVGEHVDQGEVVGYVGSTGWSTGCHLHFTILVNGNAVDPMNWLP